MVLEAESGSFAKWGPGGRRPVDGAGVNASSGTGRLVLVATPIGNLGDLAPRAVEALADADAVACEDTRHSGRLLKHAGVTDARLLRLDAHTEDRAAGDVLRRLAEGQVVAVVTDAGTPGISDPGERLVRRVVEAGYGVSVVPGPSSPVAALVASGLPTDRWCMEGFLPRKGAARAGRLAELAVEERTMVLFESPHRLAARWPTCGFIGRRPPGMCGPRDDEAPRGVRTRHAGRVGRLGPAAAEGRGGRRRGGCTARRGGPTTTGSGRRWQSRSQGVHRPGTPQRRRRTCSG